MLRGTAITLAVLAATGASLLAASLAITGASHPFKAVAARNVTVIHKTSMETWPPLLGRQAPSPACKPGQCQDV